MQASKDATANAYYYLQATVHVGIYCTRSSEMTLWKF